MNNVEFLNTLIINNKLNIKRIEEFDESINNSDLSIQRFYQRFKDSGYDITDLVNALIKVIEKQPSLDIIKRLYQQLSLIDSVVIGDWESDTTLWGIKNADLKDDDVFKNIRISNVNKIKVGNLEYNTSFTSRKNSNGFWVNELRLSDEKGNTVYDNVYGIEKNLDTNEIKVLKDYKDQSKGNTIVLIFEVLTED